MLAVLRTALPTMALVLVSPSVLAATVVVESREDSPRSRAVAGELAALGFDVQRSQAVTANDVRVHVSSTGRVEVYVKNQLRDSLDDDDDGTVARRVAESVRVNEATPCGPTEARRPDGLLPAQPGHAEGPPSSSPPLETTSDSRRLSVAATFGLTSFLSGRDGPYDRREFLQDPLTQSDVSYRFSKRLAAGAVVSYFPPAVSEYRFSRLAGEARVYAISWRFIDVWGAGEAGIAAWKFSPSDCTSCDFVSRFGPSFGLGAGVDVVALRYVSLGLEGRALLPIFLAAPVEDSPASVTPAFTVGLTLAAHIPLGGSN
jgi:hypothetical protein